MADRAVAGQRVEPLLREHVVHQAHALLEPDPLAVARRDARRLLAAVLQRVEPHVGEVRGLGVAEDAEEAALVVEVIVLEGQAAERRRPGLRSAHAPDVSIPLEAFMTPDISFPDLRSFLGQLRRDGDLAVVEAEVDPRLEAAEIHRRVIAAGGPALLFTKVRGADLPLATNLFGTGRRAQQQYVAPAGADQYVLLCTMFCTSARTFHCTSYRSVGGVDGGHGMMHTLVVRQVQGPLLSAIVVPEKRRLKLA